MAEKTINWVKNLGTYLAVCAVVGVAAPDNVWAGQSGEGFEFDPAEVTFHKDIEPILQRACQNCHKPESVAPMSLITYQQTRPWARAMKSRTSVGPRQGVMPPWYVEKNIGIQDYKNDPSLSDEEIAMIAAWADNGAPRGNPANGPPLLDLSTNKWTIGEPDLITILPDITVKGDAPDWWGEVENVPVGNTEDRYVAAVEYREFNDVDPSARGRDTVGGRYVIHHLLFSTRVVEEDDEARARETTTTWPVHEVGRNADIFDEKAGRLLAANTTAITSSIHLHSNGEDTTGHLEIAWKFHPRGYEPTLKSPARRGLADSVNIDIRPELARQELHAYSVLQTHQKLTTFEPHLHGPGNRMCLEAIWGSHIETLTCAGYDHSWVRTYEYAEHAAPLLPKGTILHLTGFMDNTAANRNIPDPRNWQGSGNRSVTNMFLDLGLGVELTDEQFLQEMAGRREAVGWTLGDHIIGCPLCPYDDLTPEEMPGHKETTTDTSQQ